MIVWLSPDTGYYQRLQFLSGLNFHFVTMTSVAVDGDKQKCCEILQQSVFCQSWAPSLLSLIEISCLVILSHWDHSDPELRAGGDCWKYFHVSLSRHCIPGQVLGGVWRMRCLRTDWSCWSLDPAWVDQERDWEARTPLWEADCPRGWGWRGGWDQRMHWMRSEIFCWTSGSTLLTWRSCWMRSPGDWKDDCETNLKTPSSPVQWMYGSSVSQDCCCSTEGWSTQPELRMFCPGSRRGCCLRDQHPPGRGWSGRRRNQSVWRCCSWVWASAPRGSVWWESSRKKTCFSVKILKENILPWVLHWCKWRIWEEILDKCSSVHNTLPVMKWSSTSAVNTWSLSSSWCGAPAM